MNVKELASRIRTRRKELHLRQEDLAVKAGISRIYLSEIERATAPRVSANILTKLAAALGISVADLTSQLDSSSGHAESMRTYSDANIIASGREGAVYFIYCEAPKGEWTKAQMEMGQALTNAGFNVVQPTPRST